MILWMEKMALHSKIYTYWAMYRKQLDLCHDIFTCTTYNRAQSEASAIIAKIIFFSSSFALISWCSACLFSDNGCKLHGHGFCFLLNPEHLRMSLLIVFSIKMSSYYVTSFSIYKLKQFMKVKELRGGRKRKNTGTEPWTWWSCKYFTYLFF